MDTTKGESRSAVPRWELSSIFPGLESEEYRTAKQGLEELTGECGRIVGDEAAREKNPGGWLVDSIGGINRLRGRLETLQAYAFVNYSTATTDPEATKEMGKLEEAALPLHRIAAEFRNALKSIEALIPSLLEANPELSGYRLFIEEELEAQRHQMSAEMEDLAADLNRAGGDAWSRLQSTIASTLTVRWGDTPGETKTATELRALYFSPDRSLREKAWSLELEAWKGVEIPLSFALNGVKGFSHTLNSRRAYPTTLERSLKQSRLSAAALEALIGAMEESLPLFQSYLKRKARMLGLKRLAFYDIFAPIAGSQTKRWSFSEAKEFILRHFAAFSPGLSAFTGRAFDKEWIDAEPRAGKVGGAYCISFPETKESRVLSNFSGSSRDVSTLAHELGHAYHHHVVRDLSPIHQDYPMPLAETASIFAETLVTDKALAELEGAARLEILESSLQDSTQVIVDILSRFYFERELMERRADHELSAAELCKMMTDAQKRSYGDALDEKLLHPYMWAVKGHYYRPELAFYNFPYAFGLLFGIALYGRYTEAPEGFAQEYRGILTDTGRLNAGDLARQAGFDIEKREFWRSGLRVIGRQVEEFAAAADMVGKGAADT
jgi:oligoendopeptidase F